MRIHHLNCMSFFLGFREVTHCLLVETPDGLVLVDTGLGTADYARPSWRVRALIMVDRVPCDLNETAISQVINLGYSPKDVRHIFLTHLHSDHSGGLPDFPWAQVHVFSKEYQTAMHPRRFVILDQVGIEPAHWAHSPKWVIHPEDYSPWFGLDSIVVLENPDIRFVPLPGHTPGHCGVAVSGDDHWLLHCGDAFFRESQMEPNFPKSPFPGWFGPIEHVFFPLGAQERLRKMLGNHSDEVRVFCSHDPDIYEDMLASE